MQSVSPTIAAILQTSRTIRSHFCECRRGRDDLARMADRNSAYLPLRQTMARLPRTPASYSRPFGFAPTPSTYERLYSMAVSALAALLTLSFVLWPRPTPSALQVPFFAALDPMFDVRRGTL